MTPSWRKPFGVLLIVALIIVWSALIVSASGLISQWHWLVQLAAYGTAGIVWILPLKPLLLWMETGKWRE